MSNRRLPRKPNERQKFIIMGVQDFFGEQNPEEKKSALRISLWLMGRRRGVALTEEEQPIAQCIRGNLADDVYFRALT